MSGSKEKGYWALAAISILWGTTWFVSKLAIQFIPPLQLTAIRQLSAGVLMISYHQFRGSRWPTRKEWVFHILCGFLLIACSNGLTTWAIHYIPSFLGALISCLMPFVLILANTWFFREPVKPIIYLALLIGFAGVALLLFSYLPEFKDHGFLFGVLLSVMGIFTWTSGTLLSVKNRLEISTYEAIGWQMLIGGLFLFLASRISGQHIPFQTIPWQAWLSMIYLVGIGSILCFVCYLYTLKTLPMSLVSIYVYINPVVALLLGVWILNERISLQMVCGMAIIFAGIYLVKKYSDPKT